MIDLKNEIEERLENAKNDYSEYPVLSKNDITLGKCKAYQDCLDVINNYNIITAPKTIKLSEIVKKLKKSLTNPKNKVNVYKENENEIVIKISYFAIGTFVDETTIDLSDKIYDIDGFNNLMSSRFKWLYALWIAGTIIEDDLKEE